MKDILTAIKEGFYNLINFENQSVEEAVQDVTQNPPSGKKRARTEDDGESQERETKKEKLEEDFMDYPQTEETHAGLKSLFEKWEKKQKEELDGLTQELQQLTQSIEKCLKNCEKSIRELQLLDINAEPKLSLPQGAAIVMTYSEKVNKFDLTHVLEETKLKSITESVVESQPLETSNPASSSVSKNII